MSSEVKANKLSPATGTDVTLGDSGDTFTVPSGATIVNSGTATGFGDDNAPAFYASRNSNQTDLAHGAVTVCTFDNEIFDSAGAYDTTTYRFTPQTAGKYFVGHYSQFTSCATCKNLQIYIFKNASDVLTMYFADSTWGSAFPIPQIFGIVDMNGSSDYLEAAVYQTQSTGSSAITGGSGKYSGFYAWKLAGIS